MPTLYIFRGKSATGKTMLTDLLSKRLGVCVLRKDDIFDPLAGFIEDKPRITQACYDILPNLIQKNLDNGIDVIVDIALCQLGHYRLFLSKLNLTAVHFFSFLCDCSDEELWLERWKPRLLNPAPNQYAVSIEQVQSYYAAMEIVSLEGETCLDSAKEVATLLEEIEHVIGK